MDSSSKADAAATSARERILFKPDLAKRYGKARETIWRWGKDGKLPPHDVIVAGRPGWREATILAFESVR